MIGRRIGSWILERELGHGGMGAVYEARHATLRTRAAVKVLSPGLESEESFRQRFHREAELQAQLRHPNVARVLDYLEDAGRWFLVVEYVDGGSLADLLARGGKVSRQQALAWTRQTLAGLGHAHQKGIVHRDVKPANLLIGANSEIVVMDFGIARSDNTPGLTATGVTVGTPHYMSPEQIMTPDRVDRRSDLYSLGVVLYELLAGRRPFDSDSQFAILQSQVSEPPPPLRVADPDVPPALESLVMRALEKKAADRYPDCESMIRELDRVADMPAGIHADAAPGATMYSSRLFEVAPVQQGPQLSPGESRTQRRRAFQAKLAGGAAAMVVVATLWAIQLSSDDTSKAPESLSGNETAAARLAPPSSTKIHVETRDQRNPTVERGTVPILRQRPVIAEPVRNSVMPPIQKTGPAVDTTRGLPRPPSQVSPPPVMPVVVVAAALPERPRIAVIGVGKEPLLAALLEEEMQRRLSQFDVGDEHGDPEVSAMLAQTDKPVAHTALGAALLKSGFQVLVLLRVVEGDRRTVAPLNIEGSLIGARMHLNAYLLPANRAIGPGWTETVEYTEASAKTKAKQAFIGPTADLRQAIRDEWTALRTASAGQH